MIVYKYSLIKDLKEAFTTWRETVKGKDGRYYFVEDGEYIAVGFRFNVFHWLWLMSWLLTHRTIMVPEPENYTCYWRSCGSWGNYYPEEKAVGICPWMLEDGERTIEGVIRHEIRHLEHPEADEMKHNDKESYINNL